MPVKRTKKGTRQADPRETGWKRRPSEIRGYQMAHYITTENGDYLRVDYNLKEKRIRIFIEDADEGGNPYFAVVSNGRIISQKNVTSGRDAEVISRIAGRAEHFNTLPPRDVRNAVKAALGLDNKGPGKKDDSPVKGEGRKEMLERTRRRYFKDGEESGGIAEESREQAPSTPLLREAADVLIGAALCAALYFFKRDFVILGIAAGVFGIALGAFDMIVRGREPSVIKVLFFMIVGLSSYIYGYYYF